MANKTLAVKVEADVRGEERIRGLGGTLAGAGVQLAKFGAVAGAAFVGVGAFASNFASDLNESMAKVGVVFGDSADDIVAWSDTAAESMGISQQKALEAAGTFGNLFDAMGLGEDATADMSTDLVQLASDLASFNNLDPTEVLEKLRAGIVGEAEPLRTLGVNISAARTEAKALELGLWDGVGALSASAKAQANFALIMEDTANAQGDFARTSEGMANQQRTLAATFEDTMADLGQAFVPIIEAILPQLTAGLQAFGSWVEDNSPAIQGTLSGVLAGIGAAFTFLVDTVLPLVVGAFQWLGDNVVPAVAGAFSFVSANVVPALVGAFEGVMAWVSANWPVISSVVGQAMGAIGNVVRSVGPIVEWLAIHVFPAVGTAAGVLFAALDVAFKGIGGAVEVAGEVVSTVVDTIVDVWDGLVDYFDGAVRAFGRIGDAIFEPLSVGFEAAIGVIKGIWNAFARFWNGIELSIPAVDVPFLGRVGGITVGVPDLPMLASGGIVTRPTLAMIGEAGPEAVVPLDEYGGAGGIIIEVNVLGDLRAEDEDSVAAAIGRVLWSSGLTDGLVAGAGAE